MHSFLVIVTHFSAADVLVPRTVQDSKILVDILINVV